MQGVLKLNVYRQEMNKVLLGAALMTNANCQISNN